MKLILMAYSRQQLIQTVRSVVDELLSLYPYSMDSLINKPERSYHSFYENTIAWLSFWGLGSANDILDMKLLEINELKQVMKNEEMQKTRLHLIGIPTND